jgi:uncharacterized protein YcbX
MDLPCAGRIVGLYRHPVKGFTPEPLESASLAAGGAFPDDRIFAVENGPSGFDPAAPGFIPKQKFAVLAALADVARARTRYDETTGVLTATADGFPPLAAGLAEPAGRRDFAAWLTALLGDGIRGPLQVVEASGHRFLDHPQGHVSLLNLASVRDLAAKIGRPVDPRRFRANILVEGWPAWAELEVGAADFALGPVRATLFQPIVRCVATHVDPDTAERDLDIVRALFEHYGHCHCGVYIHVTEGGRIAPGDPAVLLQRGMQR